MINYELKSATLCKRLSSACMVVIYGVWFSFYLQVWTIWNLLWASLSSLLRAGEPTFTGRFWTDIAWFMACPFPFLVALRILRIYMYNVSIECVRFFVRLHGLIIGLIVVFSSSSFDWEVSPAVQPTCFLQYSLKRPTYQGGVCVANKVIQASEIWAVSLPQNLGHCWFPCLPP